MVGKIVKEVGFEAGVNCKLLINVCTSLCTTGVYNTAKNNSDNLPFYPPDNYHSSGAVYWRGGCMCLNSYISE